MKKSIVTLAVLTAISTPTFAYEKGDIIVRAGVTTVSPDESSSNVFLNNGDLGFGLNVDNDTQIGLNFAYFLTDNWNVEVLAATPFKHAVNVNSNPLGLGQLGDIKHLPPTVTANYFFAQNSAAFQPYIGVGLNYTVFFDEEFTEGNEALGFSDLNLDESVGLSAQIGFDYMINSKWFFNASIRYIDISTDATFTLNNAGLGAANAPGKVTVDVNPWVSTLSLGYKF